MAFPESQAPGQVVPLADVSSHLPGVMWLELVLASVLGFVIYWFVSRDKEETLPLEDGWWGPGSKPSAKEDESIRPFKVETSDEEIKVRHPFPDRAETKASVLLCFPGTRVWDMFEAGALEMDHPEVFPGHSSP